MNSLLWERSGFFSAPHNKVGPTALLFAASDLSMPWALRTGIRFMAINTSLVFVPSISAPHTGAHHVRGFF